MTQTARNIKHLMPTRASGLWWRLISKMRRARLPKSVRQALLYCQNSGIRLLSAFLPTRLMPSLPSRAMSQPLTATCGLTSLAALTTPSPRHLESTSTQTRNQIRIDPQTALFHKLFDKDRPTLKIRFTLDNVPLTSQSSRYSSDGL